MTGSLSVKNLKYQIGFARRVTAKGQYTAYRTRTAGEKDGEYRWCMHADGYGMGSFFFFLAEIGAEGTEDTRKKRYDWTKNASVPAAINRKSRTGREKSVKLEDYKHDDILVVGYE